MRNDDGTSELYELLPAVYRLRDAEAGYPLRALLAVVAEQADLVRDNIAGLWDDLFVETCAEWVIPYIGDLVGNVPLHGAAAFGALGAGRAAPPGRRRQDDLLPAPQGHPADARGADA